MKGERRFSPLFKHSLKYGLDFNLLNDDVKHSRNIIKSLLDLTATPEHIDTYKDHSTEELEATLLFIDMLMLIPEDWRDIHEDADNEPE
jgi:hypothetical protein